MTERNERTKVIIRTATRKKGPLQLHNRIADVRDEIEDIKTGTDSFSWPPGMAPNAPSPPTFQVTPELTAGLGSFFVEWVTGDGEGFRTTYEIHVDTTSGFTPAGDTLAHERELAGTPGNSHAHAVLDFPEGHKLFDTPVNADTTYFVQIVPANDFGAAPGPYPEASVTPFKAIGDMIADETIDLARHVEGLLPEANFEGITDPAKLADAIVTNAKIAAGTIDAESKVAAGTIVGNLIAADTIASDHLAAGSVIAGKIAANAVTAGTIAAGAVIAGKIAANAVTAGTIAANAVTADKIDVANLAAIEADLGMITAGTIQGVTYRSAGSGSRIVVESGQADRIQVMEGANPVGMISWASGGMDLSAGPTPSINLKLLQTRTEVWNEFNFISPNIQSGKTGLDSYLRIEVDGVTRFLRLFN